MLVIIHWVLVFKTNIFDFWMGKSKKIKVNAGIHFRGADVF